LDRHAKICLFGSRADDSRKGGDIDLLVISKQLSDADKRAIKMRLYERIGKHKIDLLIAEDLSLPFVQLAMEEGVLL